MPTVGMGDICAIKESIATPIRQAFLDARRRHLGLGLDVNAASHVSLDSSLTTFSRTAKRCKSRPAVVIDLPSVSDTNPTVCIMATFEGTPFEHLPQICRRFAIPVRPNPRGVITIRPTPAWDRDDAWLIAYPFISQRSPLNAWRIPYDVAVDEEAQSPPLHFVLDDAALQELRDAIEIRMKIWLDECEKDPSVLDELERVFEVRDELLSSSYRPHPSSVWQDWYRGRNRSVDSFVSGYTR